jgi:hypothetical protein
VSFYTILKSGLCQRHSSTRSGYGIVLKNNIYDFDKRLHCG